MKSTALKLFHDDDHFINSIIERCPSGRCRLFKTRTAWGTDSFYRYMYMAKTINDCIFFFVKDFFSIFFQILIVLRAAISQQFLLVIIMLPTTNQTINNNISSADTSSKSPQVNVKKFSQSVSVNSVASTASSGSWAIPASPTIQSTKAASGELPEAHCLAL